MPDESSTSETTAAHHRPGPPSLTKDQMVEVDRLMVEEAGISLLQMMENAGRSLASVAVDRFSPRRVTVLAGRGGNGGGGLVAARHLANRGVAVEVLTSSDTADFNGVPLHQLHALGSTSAMVAGEPSLVPDLIIDALIGYSLAGPPRGRALKLIEWANAAPCPVLSLDVPSGIDSTSGAVPGEAVSATATLTLALPKAGLSKSDLPGEVHLADISVPPAIYEILGVAVRPDLFAESQVIRLW